MHNLDLPFDELLEEIFDADDQEKNNSRVVKFYKTISETV